MIGAVSSPAFRVPEWTIKLALTLLVDNGDNRGGAPASPVSPTDRGIPAHPTFGETILVAAGFAPGIRVRRDRPQRKTRARERGRSW